MPSKGESRVLEINTFIQGGESLIEDLHYKEGMSIIEAFPIFLVMIIFIIWNYIFDYMRIKDSIPSNTRIWEGWI